jgi:hypothetical protein
VGRGIGGGAVEADARPSEEAVGKGEVLMRGNDEADRSQPTVID